MQVLVFLASWLKQDPVPRGSGPSSVEGLPESAFPMRNRGLSRETETNRDAKAESTKIL